MYLNAEWLSFYHSTTQVLKYCAEISELNMQITHLVTIQLGVGFRVESLTSAEIRGAALRHKDWGLRCASFLWHISGCRGAERRRI